MGKDKNIRLSNQHQPPPFQFGQLSTPNVFTPGRFELINNQNLSSQIYPIPKQHSTIITRRIQHKSPSFNPIIQSHRSCTDIICCLGFVVFLAGWIFVAVIAFLYGNPDRLIHPTDSSGRICGVNLPNAYNLSSTPYLLYFDLTKCISFATVFEGCPTPQVCVSTCPSSYFSYLQLQFTSGNNTFINSVNQNVICIDQQLKAGIRNFANLKSLVNNQQCAAYTVPSTPVLGRCIPNIIIDATSTIASVTNNNNVTLNSLNSKFTNGNGLVPTDSQLANSTGFVSVLLSAESILEKICADLSVSWWQILALLLSSAVIAFLWIIVMRILGGMMIWTSIFGVFVLLAGGCGFCWYKYVILFEAGAINDYSFNIDLLLYFEMPDTWLAFGIISAIVLLIFLVIFFIICSRIRIAIALITESSRALGHMISSLFFPIFPFILHSITFIIWASIAIWLASWGQENCRQLSNLNTTSINGNNSSCNCNTIGITTMNPPCVFVNFTRNSDYVIYMQAYNLFALFWLTCFISGLSDMALAGAFASHYWAFRKPQDVPSLPVLAGLGRALRYHVGTIAFGSLILAIIKFIRVILEYIDSKLKKTHNSVAIFIMSCLKCCLCCLEKIIKFLTRNAFIMCAIYGKNFCTSARDSFLLIARNIIRVAVVDKVTAFLLFLGKFGITIGIGVVAFYYFSGKWMIKDIPTITLNYYFVPIIIVLLGTYLICDAFFGVYEMAVDTTLLCFLEDSETNDGSAERPLFMSKELQKIMGKTNHFYQQTN